nr:hypothetical protein [Alkalicoccus halolimnae]
MMVKKGSSLFRRTDSAPYFYGELEWTWGDFGAMEDEPKIYLPRSQGGRN